MHMQAILFRVSVAACAQPDIVNAYTGDLISRQRRGLRTAGHRQMETFEP